MRLRGTAVTVAAAASLLSGCGAERSVEAYCGVHDEFKEEYLSSMEAATEKVGNDFLGGLAQGAAAFGDLSNMWKEMADAAPEEIRSDTEAVAEFWTGQYETAEKAVDSPLGGLASSITGAMQVAGPMSRVDAFVRENCDAAG